MSKLLWWNGLRWYVRLPLKSFVLAVTILVVCFPDPFRLARHVRHWLDLNALIEPDSPALDPWIAELRLRIDADVSDRQALKRIERFVYEKVDYEWDWNTWGVADYLPTVAEVVQSGREDCDGQAVVAASLMRRFGFEAHLVANFAHMWVSTGSGEAMSPGRTKAVVATEGGLRVQREALVELPRAAAFGVAVFPLGREVIILAVFWWLLLRRDRPVFSWMVSLLLLAVGLVLLRAGSREYQDNVLWIQMTACAMLVFGVIVPMLPASGRWAVPRV